MALQANWDDLRLLLAVSRRGSFYRQANYSVSRPLPSPAASPNWKPPWASHWWNAAWKAAGSPPEAKPWWTSPWRLNPACDARPRRRHASNPQRHRAGERWRRLFRQRARSRQPLHSAAPGCSVELQVTTDFHKIVRGVADIAIRTAQLGEPSLIYRGSANSLTACSLPPNTCNGFLR